MHQSPESQQPHQNLPIQPPNGYANQPPHQNYPHQPPQGYSNQPMYPQPHAAPPAFGPQPYAPPPYPPKKRGMPVWAILLIVAGVVFFVLPVGCVMLVAVASSGKSRESHGSNEAHAQAPIQNENRQGGTKRDDVKLQDVGDGRLEISLDKFRKEMGLPSEPTEQGTVLGSAFNAWHFSDGRWVETFADPKDGSLITVSVAGLLEGSPDRTKAFVRRAVSAVLGRPIERDLIEKWLNTTHEMTAGGKVWQRCSGDEVIEDHNFSWSVDDIISDVGVTKPTVREFVVVIERVE